MFSIRKCFRLYVLNRFKAVKKDVLIQKDNEYHKAIKTFFKANDKVETKTRERGTVWQIYREKKSNKIVGCAVIWDTEYKGEKVSLFLPATDLGRKFNPQLRKII